MTIWKSLLCVLLLASFAQAEDASLRWRFRTGDTQDYRMTQTAKLELELPGGSKLNADVEREFDFRWTIQSIDPNGTATIAIDVTAVKLHVTGPGGQNANYDSTAEKEPRGFAASLAPLFQAILKAELIAAINPRGELVSLQVPEELQSVLRSKPAGKAVGQLGAVADLESLARLGLPALPASADFAQGGEWHEDRTIQVASLGPLVANTTYRWESTRDDNGEQIARIVPATVFQFPEPEQGKLSIAPGEELASGEILFNVSTGQLKSAVYNDAMTLTTQTSGKPTVGTLHHTLAVEQIDGISPTTAK